MVASGQHFSLTLTIMGPEARGRGSRVHLEGAPSGESLAIWDSPVRVDPHLRVESASSKWLLECGTQPPASVPTITTHRAAVHYDFIPSNKDILGRSHSDCARE